MGNASSLQSKVPWIEAQAGAGRQLPSCSVACQAACWRAWTLVCQEAHPRAPPLHRAPCLPRAPASLRCRCDLPNRAQGALRQRAGSGAGLTETRAWQRRRFFNRPRRGAARLRGILRTRPARRLACPPWLLLSSVLVQRSKLLCVYYCRTWYTVQSCLRPSRTSGTRGERGGGGGGGFIRIQ